MKQRSPSNPGVSFEMLQRSKARASVQPEQKYGGLEGSGNHKVAHGVPDTQWVE